MKQRILAGFVAITVALAQLPAASTFAQAASEPSSAETESKAREAFTRGRVHYDNGEFYRAAQAFEEAYSLSGRDVLFYNIYLAYRDANEQERAAEALRNYLTRVEVIENRAQLEARLKALEDGIAARKAEAERKLAERQKALEEAAAQNQAQPQSDQPQAATKGRWWLVPVAVMGVGGAMALSSVATGLMAKSKQNELDDKCKDGVCPDSLKSTADSGKTLALVTDVLLFGGVAVGAAGAVLLFLKRPKSNEAPAQPRTTAGLACTGRGCAGSMAIRF